MELSAPNILAGVVIGLLVGLALGSEKPDYSSYEDQVSEARYQCESVKDDYVKALKQANSNIENANYEIDAARSYAWSDYEDMSDMLESLEDIEEVRQPKISCY